MNGDFPSRLVVFDVDGTLVDSQAHIMAAMEYAYRAVGIAPPGRAEVLSIVGLSLPLAIERLAPDLSPGTRLALAEGYRESFASLRQTDGENLSSLFPGMRPVLDGLLGRDDLLVGIATGKSRRGLRHVLAAHGLTGAFVTEQVADDHPSKPNPSMLFRALEKTGAEARNAVMIGDTTFDIEMGRAAGFATIGVAWGYHPTDALRAAGADCIVETAAALPARIESLRGRP
ncbi:HAD-IA family hydrolase [Tropicimonas sp.]|uniref:HAD-IA family hydrolase n=1 Tax=Tropicimonas sp. TaxID=2067044 RepID=UPI003A83BFEE